MFYSVFLFDFALFIPLHYFHIYIANSKKVALGIGNWALGSYCLAVAQAKHCYCLAVIQAKHCIVFVCPIANDQLPKQPLLN